MPILNRTMMLAAATAGLLASVPMTAHAYPFGYRGGYGYRGGWGYGGWGYRGWGAYGAGLAAGGYYGGYYAPRPYYVAPPVVYAAPPVYYPAPTVSYQVPLPPAPRRIVHRARVIHRAAPKPAVCIPPVLSGPLPKNPLTSTP